MAIPVITLNDGPDVAVISEEDDFNESVWHWQPDIALLDYEVMVVADNDDSHDDGTLIPAAGGSTNVTGGPVAAEEEIETLITGTDLKAVAPDGPVTVKFFGRSLDTEEWSGG